MPDLATPAPPVPAGLKNRHLRLMLLIRGGDNIQRNSVGQDIIRRHSSGFSGRCDKDLRDITPTYATLEGTSGTFWRLTDAGNEALDAFLAVRDANVTTSTA